MEERDETDWKGAADDMESDVRDVQRQHERFSQRADEHEQTWESRKDDEQAPGAMDPDEHLISVDTDRAKQREQEEQEQRRQEEEEAEEEDEGPPEQSAGDSSDDEEHEDDQ